MTEHNRRPTVALVAAAIVAMAVAAYFMLSQRDDGGKAPSFLVAEAMAPMMAPLFIADARDLWSENELEATPREFLAGRLCLDAILSGSAEVGSVADTPLVHAGMQGQEFKILCTFMSSDRDTRCIARKDRGATIPAQLRGKKVGVFVGTNGEFYLDQFLKKNGLSMDDITAVNLQPAAMVNAFISGSIDAAVSWEPHIHNMLREVGDQAVLFPAGDVYTSTFNLVCLDSFAQENPAAIERILTALLAAADFIENNREDSITLVAERLKMDRETLSAVWDTYDFDVSLGPELLASLSSQAQWVDGESEVPDFRDFILNEPLRSVRPEAVRLD